MRAQKKTKKIVAIEWEKCLLAVNSADHSACVEGALSRGNRFYRPKFGLVTIFGVFPVHSGFLTGMFDFNRHG